MPCFHSPEGGEVPVLWAADQGEYSGEEAVPAVRRVGLQDDSVGGGATGTEEGAEDHCVRGVREASVAAQCWVGGVVQGRKRRMTRGSSTRRIS